MSFFRGCGRVWFTRFVISMMAVSALTGDTRAADKSPSKAAGVPPAPAPATKAADEGPSPVEKAAALRAAGRLEEAIQVLRDANRDIKKADGEESPRLLPVNNLAAEVLIDLEHIETAASLVEKTMALHESLLATDKVSKESLGSTLVVFARIHFIRQEFLAAIEKAARALPLLDTLDGPRSEDVARGSDILETSVENLERLVGPNDTMTSDARAKAADAFESLGRLDQAIAQRKGIFKSVSSRGDQAHIDAAADRLGHLMKLGGRSNEAIAILESDPAPSASRMRLLGELQLAANHLLAADASLAAAMDTAAAVAKPSATVIAGDRFLRLLVAIRRGRVRGLPDWFETTRSPLAKASPADAAAANGLVAASEVLVSLGRPAAAIVPLHEAAALVRKQQASASKGRPVVPRAQPSPQAKPGPQTKLGPHVTITPLMADIASRLAAAHLASGDHDAALKVAQPDIGPAADSLGPGDGRVTLLRAVAAGAASAGGDGETAAGLASQALAYGLPRPDDAWEEVLTAIYDRLAASDDKTNWRGDFIAARVRQFGEGHPHVATAWSFFGTARLAAGDWPAAIEYFSKSLDLNRATYGEANPEVAASLSLLAHAQRAGGDPAQAARTAAEAVAILERSVGRSHPATLEAVDVLVASRLQAGMKDGVAELLERLSTAEAMSEPVRRAYHLARFAEVTAGKDKVSARTRVQAAMALPCWNPDQNLTPSQRRQLADTAAYAARAYRIMGDEAAGQTTLLKARSIALRLDESGSLLDRIERLATPER